jgi:hypothetical protein
MPHAPGKRMLGEASLPALPFGTRFAWGTANIFLQFFQGILKQKRPVQIRCIHGVER